MGICGWEFAPVMWWQGLPADQQADWAGSILTALGLFLALIAPLIHNAWQSSNARQDWFNSVFQLASRSLVQVNLMRLALDDPDVMNRYLARDHTTTLTSIETMLKSIPMEHMQSGAALISILDVIEAHEFAMYVDQCMPDLKSGLRDVDEMKVDIDETAGKLNGAMSEIRKLTAWWPVRVYHWAKDSRDAMAKHRELRGD